MLEKHETGNAGKNICLFALKRSNSKENWPKSVRQLIFKLRRRVETVFSQLSGQLNAERVLAKSFQGLCTRLVNKVLAYNLCIALNSIFGETCELGKSKIDILKILFFNICKDSLRFYRFSHNLFEVAQ